MGRKILADAGYDVVTVNNGSAALKRITEIKPDLIVLDVYMPGYSGLEVCQRLKDAQETAHIPVLLTVGKLEPFKVEEGRRVRADSHIVKPFEASELLTAITRLEDSIVPQAEAGRLRNEGNGRKAETDVSADNGWKSRLGFSSKKKKEEKESVAAGGSFRDFRKGKPKAGADEAAKVAEGQKGQGQGQAFEPVRDIPRDITPEELDVLSALAAKLNKPGTQSENIAPPAEAMPLETAETVISPAPEAVEARFADERKFETEPQSEVRAFVVVAERDRSLQADVQTPAPVSAAAEVAAEIPGFAVAGSSAIEIPVEHLEAVAEGASSAADPLAGEPVPHGPAELRASEVAENQPAEMPAAVSTVVVDTASLAQEPAPVDQNDEPRFALAANAVERTTQGIENQTEVAQSAEVTKVCESTEAVAFAGTVASTEPESPREVSESQASASQDFASQASNPEEFPASLAHSVPLAADPPAMEAHEDPAPSDEELAQALRLLTPSNGHGDLSTFPSHVTLAAAGQHLAEEVARGAAAGSRWMARPVALSHEEATVSLEAEMFRA